MIELTFFTRPECGLCRAALHVVKRVRGGMSDPISLEIVDISAPGNDAWLEAYHDHIPVVHVNGVEVFRHRVDERKLRDHLSDLASGGA